MSNFTGSLNAVKQQWFASKGYVDMSLTDQEKAYLIDNGAGSSADELNTLWYNFLSAKGQTGSFKDMYVAELIKSTASVNSSMTVSDLEYKFYGDSANTFA